MHKLYLKSLKKIKQEETDLIVKNFKKPFKVLLVYPNSYYIGMSNLGFQTIYKIINSHSEVYCERAFLPDFNLKPVSFETYNYPENFDIIIFSVSFEIDFLNILKFLNLSKIPYFRKDRKNFPLLAAGGIAVTLNYKPLYKIFDYLFIGEGEEIVTQFLNKICAGENPEDINGIIGPNKIDSNRIVYNGEKIAHSVFSTKFTEFSNTFLIEIARGCKYKCNFCASSYNYSPYRIKKIQQILVAFEKNLQFFKKVGLIGSTVTSHPDFLKICNYLNKKGIPFSLTSLRLDSVTSEILTALISGKNNTFTVAIESASNNLREKINKKLTDEQIFEAISKFIEQKVINLKFYFIIGLPYETFDDISEIIFFMEKVKKKYLSKKYYLKHLGKFNVSINPFIPKPNTPFYNFPMESIEILNKKINFLKNNLKKIPNVNVKFEDITMSYFQGLICKSDFKFANILIDIVEKNIKLKSFFKKNINLFKKYQVLND